MGQELSVILQYDTVGPSLSPPDGDNDTSASVQIVTTDACMGWIIDN